MDFRSCRCFSGMTRFMSLEKATILMSSSILKAFLIRSAKPTLKPPLLFKIHLELSRGKAFDIGLRSLKNFLLSFCGILKNRPSFIQMAEAS